MSKVVPIRKEEVFSWQLKKLEDKGEVQVLKAVNLYCKSVCPFIEGESGAGCQNPSCPIGIMKRLLSEKQIQMKQSGIYKKYRGKNEPAITYKTKQEEKEPESTGNGILDFFSWNKKKGE